MLRRLFHALRVAASSAFDASDTEDDRLNKTLMLFAAGLMSFAAVLWLAIYWVMGMRLPSTVPLVYQAVSALSVIVFFKNRNFELFRTVQLSLFLFVPFVVQWSIGSFMSASGVSLWALMAPIGAVVCQGPRESVPWFFAYGVFTAISGVFDFLLADAEPRLPFDAIAVFFVLNFLAISTMVFLLIGYFVTEKERIKARLRHSHELLQAEQDKSERLLLNILPAPVAERLKAQHSTIADGFADVTVMFADIVNFTRLTEEMAPKQMVALLNDVFSAFDGMAERHGLEKIKTIGDAYMVAGGLAESDTDYARAIAELALEMTEAISRYQAGNAGRLEIHIGIGTGPVVAGVIGKKRFIYDLWGDTVNIASRMMSEARAGAINVDSTTFRRLKGRYLFQGPRLIQLKGKGQTEVYQLLGRLSEDAAEGAAQLPTRHAG